MLDQDSYIKILLRLLQLGFASVSLILLCLRLRAYDLVSDTPPAVLTLTAIVAGLSALGSFLGLIAVCRTRARLLACVVDAHIVLLSLGAVILLAIQLRPTDRCTADQEILDAVEILRPTAKQRKSCEAGDNKCGDLVTLCKRSRAVLFLQVASVLALVAALVLEALRRRRRNTHSRTENEEDAIQLDDKGEGFLGL
ncbi:hypothetical protein OPT61_g4818 [Boeremia exigua]|uniref:Uncharacterized protein n=1 Tax=Boeremia exigua TaxID=749465 RepID=A0ACC2ICR5_9PLEO|nr:hypothetical protein OPT61_g4818 [Boeremia exigua]